MLKFPLAFLSFFLIANQQYPASANTVETVHDLCKNARDYEGCFKALQGQRNGQISYESTTDILGLPIIPNWIMHKNILLKSVTYIDPVSIKRLLVRSVYGRYFTFSYIKRDFTAAIPAVQGYYGKIIPEKSTCEWEKGKKHCTTYPAYRIWHPAKPAKPAYIKEERNIAVLDCRDRTAKWSSRIRRWRSANTYFLLKSIDRYCKDLNALPISENLKYASGTPSADDLEFIRSNKQP